MRIIVIGDVVGAAGTEYAVKNINKIKNAEKGHLVIVNAENAAPGNGLDTKSAEALLAAGADVLTGGNHTLKRHEVFDFLNENPYAIRPLNLPPAAPGKGFTIIRANQGLRVMVINVLGQVFMDPVDNPFNCVDRLLAEQEGKYDLCVCDVHAEATSEKAAFARYFDGRIQVIFGTHTHVQTADECLLSKGSGFITDIGMCGPVDSILGIKPEPVIKNFVTRIHDRFEAGEGEIKLCGAVFEINTQTKAVTSVKRIRY
ncbi:MAG TPA: TIGR00282 family metallophosphoesterase [Bacillota bacterium]|nr:TIGR00282 family metallophosphoesterase [Bacillota bacterium]HOK69407.1 TIGR00282 family metallophosphoesterase [Bacillota bacterium]